MLPMETFADRLKACRERRQLTQDQVAKAVGITRTMVSQWEHGRREPQVDSLVTLADLYGVTVDFLLKGGAGEIGTSGSLDRNAHVDRYLELAEQLTTVLLQHEENERLRIEHVEAPRAEAARLAQETLRTLLMHQMQLPRLEGCEDGDPSGEV